MATMTFHAENDSRLKHARYILPSDDIYSPDKVPLTSSPALYNQSL